MKQYLELAQDILDNGIQSEDRTGTGTISVFGRQLRFDLSKGFPLLTTKKLHFKSIAIELLWFLKGDTNTEWLKENGVTIWDEWAEKEEHPNRRKGDLGPIYGKQWRDWETTLTTGPYTGLSKYEINRLENAGFEYIASTPLMGFWSKTVDQIKEVIKSIKENPYSRRHVISAWNVGELDLMNLITCHYTFQFYVRNGKLSCMYTMRSNDYFIGQPYNIASYALLTHMIAHVCGLEVGELIYNGGDIHIYNNHIEQAKLQLTREPKPLPTLKFAREVKDIDDFKFEDFIIENYEAHPHIKAAVAV